MTDSFDFDEPVGESPESRLCKELLGQDYEEDPESVFDKMNADRRRLLKNTVYHYCLSKDKIIRNMPKS